MYLGKSFGNLPSPVNETPTIKKLFKFNEDEKDAKPRNESKNQQIRIEGKDVKIAEKKSTPVKDFKIDLKELNKIVFEQSNHNDAY